MSAPDQLQGPGSNASDAGTEVPDQATLEAHTKPFARPQPPRRSPLFWLVLAGVAFGVIGAAVLVAGGVAWYIVSQR